MALSGGKPLASSLYPSTEYQGVIRKIAGTKRMAMLICAYPVSWRGRLDRALTEACSSARVAHAKTTSDSGLPTPFGAHYSGGVGVCDSYF
jgi:hypothetical protein